MAEEVSDVHALVAAMRLILRAFGSDLAFVLSEGDPERGRQYAARRRQGCREAISKSIMNDDPEMERALRLRVGEFVDGFFDDLDRTIG